MALGIVVDLSSAWLIRSATLNDLAAARDQVSSAPISLMVKNAANPGEEIATQVAESLRANGFKGEIKVWCYEAPASDLPTAKRESRRILAWTAQALQEWEPPFSSSWGLSEQTIGADVTSSSVPYSGGTTWRPANDGEPVGNGLYMFAAGSSTFTYSALGGLEEGSWPNTIGEAVNDRMADIRANRL